MTVVNTTDIASKLYHLQHEQVYNRKILIYMSTVLCNEMNNNTVHSTCVKGHFITIVVLKC